MPNRTSRSINSPATVHALITGLLLLAFPASVLADVVRPPPRNCPKGYRPGTSHSGPYCAPPPPRCKKGHKPRVIRARAYCEPPPAKPCPAGSFWTSSSKTQTYCRGGNPCANYPCYQKDWTCRETSLCVHVVRMFRAGYYEVAYGTCKTDADCKGYKDPGGEEIKCVTVKRCDPNKKRGAKPGAKPEPPAKKPEPPAKKSEPPAKKSEPPAKKPEPPAKKTKPDQKTGTPPSVTKSGGCAGCALTSAPAPRGWPLILLLMLALLRRRR